MRNHAISFGALALAVVMTACSPRTDGTPPGPNPPATTDAGPGDVIPGSGSDAGSDAVADAGSDTVADAGSDSVADAGSDSVADAGTTDPEPANDGLPTAKRTFEVRTIAELKTRIGAALPGDRIELADGDYTNATPIVVSVHGTEADPIVITAKNVGAATISGAAGFTVDGAAYVVLRGFKLTHAVSAERVLKLIDSNHVRITRNEFAINDTTPKSIWLYVDGVNSGYNRIDHNYLHHKASQNVFLAIYGDAADGGPAMSQHDRVDHNYFYSQTAPVEGGECIRIGDSARGPLASNALIESNLFEKCDGDPEVISAKSSDTVYRNNTLRNNKGSLVLRHGNRNRVEGNIIINNVGGMRVYGHDHVIVNNYFEANSGTGAQSTLVLNSGCTEADTGNGTDCSRPVNVAVAHNTFVGNLKTHLVIGSATSTRPLAPRDCAIENNLIEGDQATLVSFERAPENFSWAGNILWGAAAVGDIPTSGYRKVDPLLARGSDGLFRPASGSPALGTAAPTAASYGLTTRDVGASGLGSAYRPLAPSDVGPLAP